MECTVINLLAMSSFCYKETHKDDVNLKHNCLTPTHTPILCYKYDCFSRRQILYLINTYINNDLKGVPFSNNYY